MLHTLPLGYIIYFNGLMLNDQGTVGLTALILILLNATQLLVECSVSYVLMNQGKAGNRNLCRWDDN